MARHLVYRPFLWAVELAVLTDDSFLQEVSDFVARCQEVVIADMIISAGSKLSL